MSDAALKRILMVDDDEDVRALGRLSLERVGRFEVAICESGPEALDVVTGFEPDLILLDVMMPGMDGRETLERIQQIPEAESVPVVFLTAKVMDREVDAYRGLGVAGVIAKPFDPMALPERLREIWRSEDAKRSG